MATATTIMQWLSIIGMVLIVVCCAWIVVRWRRLWFVAVAPLLWSVFGIVFYVLFMIGRLSTDRALLWSALHRAMAVALVLGTVVMLWIILSTPLPMDDYDEADGYE